MKVGHTIGGLTVTDVKRVNKLNLIQFLKEVDNYLQQGYRIDVNSARQVGLVLQVDLFKAEAASSVKVGSVGEQTPAENVASKEAVADSSAVAETTSAVETSVETVEDTVKEESVAEVDQPKETAVVEEAPKKTTTRSKKTVQ